MLLTLQFISPFHVNNLRSTDFLRVGPMTGIHSICTTLVLPTQNWPWGQNETRQIRLTNNLTSQFLLCGYFPVPVRSLELVPAWERAGGERLLLLIGPSWVLGSLSSLGLDRAVIMVVCEETDLDSKSSEVRRRIIWRSISQNTTLASESENLEGTRGGAGTT